jgi:3,4-dihydroxy 2-butanone 4-phosphate synthase/GTP cyclohydrolase II
MANIATEGTGAVVYLRGHEGRGIGLAHKLQAYCLQDEGLDTLDANLALGLPVDSREYGIGAQILADLGITSIRIMTNNPAKRIGLEGFDITIVDQIAIRPRVTADNVRYLRTKRNRMGHTLEGLPAAVAVGDERPSRVHIGATSLGARSGELSAWPKSQVIVSSLTP